MNIMEAEVPLIVKAPNQQTDDVKIRASATWTIRELKAHLADVYPSKPKTEEQKIIYSGQLLEDATILKDVLRVYEGQEAHTMHLVCTPKRSKMAGRVTPVVTGEQADGLRRRNAAGEQGAETDRPPEAPLRPEMRQNDQNHTVEIQSFFSHLAEGYGRVPAPHPGHSGLVNGAYPLPTDPVALANHIALMQQAYMRYIQQYADMWQTAGFNTPGVQPVNVPNETAPQPAPAPAVEPVDEDADAPRDWLDWLYATSRLAILFSLLYFYSSPFRLLVVTLLAVVGYLYQLGFFREGNDVRQNDVRQNDQPQAQNERDRNDQPEGVRPADNGTDNAEAPRPDAPAEAPTNETNQQSHLAGIWMIFSTFFTSLIPDTPNVV